jgi:alkanesulfonate monooxygenase SsuD/methylene tetrahydromethanopterin reductase-like flavin-dependent oxidoreductase (luciferase family)
LAEKMGFDSVWVRDHLIFEPHGEMEDPNRSFFDSLSTLTAIGAVTDRIELGTGSLIPFRHPLHTAAVVATMTQLTVKATANAAPAISRIAIVPRQPSSRALP